MYLSCLAQLSVRMRLVSGPSSRSTWENTSRMTRSMILRKVPGRLSALPL